MRCYTVDGSGLDSLKMVERPDLGEPGPGQVVVDVHAVSLNYRDLMVADGRYSGKQDPPIIPCADMAGTVVAVGPNVTELNVGDRVLNAPFQFWPGGSLRSEWIRTFVGGSGVDGVLSEQIVYPAVSLLKVPDYMTFQEGSTLTIAGLTAWAAVMTHGHLKPGQWMLAHGTGGVSIYAAQIAKKIGAHVILSTSSEEKGKIVQEKFGVDAVIDYREPEWHKTVKKITGGKGVNVVVEVGGGSTFSNSLQACALNGRVSLIGVLGGAGTTFNVLHLFMRQLTVRGIMMESTEELRRLARALEAWEVHPCIDRVFPFGQAREAYEHLQSQKHIGKVVIEVKA